MVTIVTFRTPSHPDMIATAGILVIGFRTPVFAERTPAVHAMSTPAQLRTSPSTLLRFVAVGACNTVFGYGCFAFFTMLLMPLIAYGYVVASLLSNLVAITFSFLGYKWFVFRTRGHYLKEWVRCIGIYAGGMLLSAAALPVLVPIIRRQTGNARTAPYVAGALVLVFSLIFSFFGHRHFSFAGSKPSPEVVR